MRNVTRFVGLSVCLLIFVLKDLFRNLVNFSSFGVFCCCVYCQKRFKYQNVFCLTECLLFFKMSVKRLTPAGDVLC